jgi:actin-related protein
MCQVAYDFS